MFYTLIILNISLFPFKKVESNIDQPHKDSLEEEKNERILVSENPIWVQKLKFDILDSLLIGLGQYQQQHPAVHTGGVSRERV